MANSLLSRSVAMWLAENVPDPASVTLSGLAFAAATRSWMVLNGLDSGTTTASAVYWKKNTGATSSVL